MFNVRRPRTPSFAEVSQYIIHPTSEIALGLTGMLALKNIFKQYFASESFVLPSNDSPIIPDHINTLLNQMAIQLLNEGRTVTRRRYTTLSDLERLQSEILYNDIDPLCPSYTTAVKISSAVHDYFIRTPLYGYPSLVNQGIEFILSTLLKGSTLTELEDFESIDSLSLDYFISKAIFIFAYGELKNSPIPLFFTTETRQKIQSFRDISLDNDLAGELTLLFERFDNFNKDLTEKPNLEKVRAQLKGAAFFEYNIMDNSKFFLQECWINARTSPDFAKLKEPSTAT